MWMMITNYPQRIYLPRPSDDRGGVTWEEWDSQFLCNRCLEGHGFEDPKMTKPKQGERYIDYFMYFLPVNFFMDVILKETNKEMMSGRGGGITWGECIRFVVLWCLTPTVAIDCDRSSYWDSSFPIMWKGVQFRLGEYLAGWKFEAIVISLRFTDQHYPSYKDKFH